MIVLTESEVAALVVFAVEQINGIEGERCQQGGDCPGLATHEHCDGGYVLCVGCAEHWWFDDDDDLELIAAGLADGSMRVAAGGYERRMRTRRRDAADAIDRLPSSTVGAMLVLERHLTR